MIIATHLIKIFGKKLEKTELITEELVRKYINLKMKEIDPVFHAEVELLKIQEKNVEIWVYISAFPSEIVRGKIKKWLKNHIKEDFEIINFEIHEVMSMDKKLNRFYIILH